MKNTIISLQAIALTLLITACAPTLDDIAKWEATGNQEKLIEGKKEYNLKDKTICYLRKPTSQWIRLANELLQANFDHHRIFFASRAIDDAYNEQRNKKIPIQDIKFLRTSQSLERQTNAAKMIDFVEHQFDMMNLIKTQCLILVIILCTKDFSDKQ